MRMKWNGMEAKKSNDNDDDDKMENRKVWNEELHFLRMTLEESK